MTTAAGDLAPSLFGLGAFAARMHLHGRGTPAWPPARDVVVTVTRNLEGAVSVRDRTYAQCVRDLCTDSTSQLVLERLERALAGGLVVLLSDDESGCADVLGLPVDADELAEAAELLEARDGASRNGAPS